MQIFSDNPTAWRRREAPPPELPAFIDYRRREGLEPLTIHASYLINLAGSTQPFAAQSRSGLAHELRRAEVYGARMVNTHIGSHRQEGADAGIRQVCANVKAVLADSPPTAQLVLENSAGSGDELGATVEELARILDGVQAPVERLGFCLDTAHLWGAGYDVAAPEGADAVIGRFDVLIGLERLSLIHLNDSRAPLGSRWDRHEHVGAGQIGPIGLGTLLRDHRLRSAVFILETPGFDDGYDAVNMRRARALFRGAETLPRLPAAAFRLTRRSSRASPVRLRAAG